MKDYLGKFVFLERQLKDGSISYDSGEYFCVLETKTSLYCVRLGGGYRSHELKIFPIIGKLKWNVVEAYRDSLAAEGLAEDLEIFVKERVGKWVESVYAGAASNAKKIRKVLKSQLLKFPNDYAYIIKPEPVEVYTEDEKTHLIIKVRPGDIIKIECEEK